VNHDNLAIDSFSRKRRLGTLELLRSLAKVDWLRVSVSLREQGTLSGPGREVRLVIRANYFQLVSLRFDKL